MVYHRTAPQLSANLTDLDSTSGNSTHTIDTVYNIDSKGTRADKVCKWKNDFSRGAIQIQVPGSCSEHRLGR